MNPDTLFDYLEGGLPAAERAALEEQLISDRQLQRELAVARQIHAGMHGDSREVFLSTQPDVTERGRKMALRIGAVFIILMALNVGVGLWLIARHESKNPNRAVLEAQTRQQIFDDGVDTSAVIGRERDYDFGGARPTRCYVGGSCCDSWAAGRFCNERTSRRASHWRACRSPIES